MIARDDQSERCSSVHKTVFCISPNEIQSKTNRPYNIVGTVCF